MFWQIREILRQYNVTPDNQTYIVNLPKANFLSGLLCKYEATNGATAGVETLPGYLSSISILADGSSEIYYMDGNESILANTAIYKRPAALNISTSADADVGFSFVIPFGRYLGDPNFFLDCSRYSSLELRVTFAPTVDTTGIVTGSQYFTVLGLLAMETPPGARIATLKTTRKYYLTSSASGDLELNLPRGNVYRKLVLMDEGNGADITAAFSRISLDINNGEKILFSADSESLHELVNFHEDALLLITDDTSTKVASTAYPPCVCGSFITIPFDVGNEITNGLNSAQYGAIKLILTQAAASHTIAVALQELII